MSDPIEVNGLPLPPLLVMLMRRGLWRDPGDDVIQAVIPFLQAKVDFLRTADEMEREWVSSGSLADDPRTSDMFLMRRGRDSGEPIELPWLDVDRSFLIALERIPGDVVGIALDYRTDPVDPRVVAKHWRSNAQGCQWREVAATFTEFAHALGLTNHRPHLEA